MKLELNIEEANALASLLDLAVKAGGIRTAAVALPLMAKIEEAARSATNNKESN